MSMFKVGDKVEYVNGKVVSDCWVTIVDRENVAVQFDGGKTIVVHESWLRHKRARKHNEKESTLLDL